MHRIKNGNELDYKFQIYDGNELASNSNSIVWMSLEFDVRIKGGVTNSISCLDVLNVQAIEFDILSILNNIF
jgi:hypothetical protein